MYTKQYRPAHEGEDANSDWVILDPQGDFVICVATESAADALLSHLNR